MVVRTSTDSVTDSPVMPDLPYAPLDAAALLAMPAHMAPAHTETLTPAELLANFNDMRRWLAGIPPENEVGDPSSAISCPIARFLTDSGVDWPVVSTEMVGWEDSRECRLPRWAECFVGLVDSQRPDAPISAAHAMTLLYQAVRQSIGR